MRYQAGFGRSELKGVGINTGKKLKDCGALELRSLGTGGVADPKIHAPPHMCYHVKFGTVMRQRVYASIKRNCQIWGELEARPFWVGRG